MDHGGPNEGDRMGHNDQERRQRRIFREDRAGKFFLASKSGARDKALSWEARGLLAYLQSLHPSARVTLKDLEERGHAGRHAIRKMVQELEDRNYLSRQRIRLDHGHFDYLIKVYGSRDLHPDDPNENHESHRLPKSGTGRLAEILPDTNSPIAADRLPFDRPPVDRTPADRLPVRGHIKDRNKKELESEELKDVAALSFEAVIDKNFEDETHTQQESANGVCVPSSIDFIDQEQDEYEDGGQNPWDVEPFSYADVERYVYWCKNRLGDDIRSPTGLVRTILRERDSKIYFKIESVLMDREIELIAEADRRAQQEAARLQYERDQQERQRRAQAELAEAERRQTQEAEAKRQREIEEAPQRERERLAKESEQDRLINEMNERLERRRQQRGKAKATAA
ncbi:MAG TPA: hypothetical protein VE135_25860 [Pyrinomonadaceae bacterium]|nr:hypothetical protein [Pyrinomonadaceae bacterium]